MNTQKQNQLIINQIKMKKNNYLVALVMLASTLMLIASCKKENSNEPTSSKEPISLADANKNIFNKFAFSPWHIRSNGLPAEQGIIDMSEPDQFTCYGIVFDGEFNSTNELTITHDGGATWRSQTVAELDNNWIFGVAATTPRTAHVFGYNFNDGGGNVFRTTDGGTTWQREAPNAYTDPGSFPDAIEFFNPRDGVIFGDPENGSFEIYTTHNGGNTWSRVPSNKIPAPLANEYGTAYITDKDNNTIWTLTVITDDNFNYIGARLLQSDDKGVNWYVRNSSMTFAPGSGDGTIKFRNHSVGLYKNNGVLYRTTDGGTTFNEVNYSGKWFSFDFDNIPGLPGWWISTGGGPGDETNSIKGSGSSISYDDGNHWITLDTLNHTCVDMTSPIHGYSGGISTGSGNDGVFVYLFSPLGLQSLATARNATTGNPEINIPHPSGNTLLHNNKFVALQHFKKAHLKN